MHLQMQSSTTKLTILKYVLVNSLHVQYSVYASGVLCARAAQHAALGELLGGRAVELAQTLADDLSRVHARVCTNSTHALAHDAPPPLTVERLTQPASVPPLLSRLPHTRTRASRVS